jgi:Type IV secretion system pilin
MKKILTILFLTLTIGFVSQPVYAATDVLTNTCANAQQNSGHAPGICGDNQTNNTTNPISSIFKTVLELLSWAIGFIAVVVIIIAGLRLVVSGGDPQTLNSARNAILYAVVGLIVAALAQIIVFFVLGKV